MSGSVVAKAIDGGINVPLKAIPVNSANAIINPVMALSPSHSANHYLPSAIGNPSVISSPSQSSYVRPHNTSSATSPSTAMHASFAETLLSLQPKSSNVATASSTPSLAIITSANGKSSSNNANRSAFSPSKGFTRFSRTVSTLSEPDADARTHTSRDTRSEAHPQSQAHMLSNSEPLNGSIADIAESSISSVLSTLNQFHRDTYQLNDNAVDAASDTTERHVNIDDNTDEYGTENEGDETEQQMNIADVNGATTPDHNELNDAEVNKSSDSTGSPMSLRRSTRIKSHGATLEEENTNGMEPNDGVGHAHHSRADMDGALSDSEKIDAHYIPRTAAEYRGGRIPLPDLKRSIYAVCDKDTVRDLVARFLVKNFHEKFTRKEINVGTGREFTLSKYLPRINESIEPFGVYVETSKDFYDKNVWLYGMNYLTPEGDDLTDNKHKSTSAPASTMKRKSTSPYDVDATSFKGRSSERSSGSVTTSSPTVKTESPRQNRRSTFTSFSISPLLSSDKSSSSNSSAHAETTRLSKSETKKGSPNTGVREYDVTTSTDSPLSFREYYTGNDPRYREIALTMHRLFGNASVMHAMARLLGNHFQHDFHSSEIKTILKNQGFSPAACMQQINNKIRAHGVYMKQTFVTGNRKAAKYGLAYVNDQQHPQQQQTQPKQQQRQKQPTLKKEEAHRAIKPTKIEAEHEGSVPSSTTSPADKSASITSSPIGNMSRSRRSDSISSSTSLPLLSSSSSSSPHMATDEHTDYAYDGFVQPYDLASKSNKRRHSHPADELHHSADAAAGSSIHNMTQKKAKHSDESGRHRQSSDTPTHDSQTLSSSLTTALPPFSEWSYLDVRDQLYSEIPMLQDRYGKTIDSLRLKGFDFIHFGNSADEISDLLGFADKKNVVTQMICKRIYARIALWKEQYPG